MRVLNTDMYDKGFDSVIKDSIELLKTDVKNLRVSLSDANVLVHSRTKKDFHAITKQFFWNLPDGVPTIWVLKLKGSKNASRISGYDYFEQLVKAGINLNVKHYFCGGKPGVAGQLKEKCSTWGKTIVSGYSTPPFKDSLSEEDIKVLAEDINKTQPDILWVGLGAPKQLYFAHEISKHINVKLVVTIGAAFDFHTGAVKKAPPWISSSGFEWLYRLLKEPNRLFKRYLNTIPKFILYNLLDR